MHNEGTELPELAGVNKTALYVLVWKNEGAFITYAPPVYKADPYMPLFFNEKIARDAKELLPRPESYRAVQIRRKHIKHVLSQETKKAESSEQIILLGSGLDTLPLYKGKKWSSRVSGLRFFEVDQEPVLKYKSAVLAKHSLSRPSAFISIDYTCDQFIAKLSEAGVKFNLKTHIVWEGNTYYLKREDIIVVLRKLREAFQGHLLITFDYFAEAVIRKQTQSPAMNDLQDEFESMGAPFKTGFDDIAAFASENGFHVLNNATIPEIDKLYFSDKAPKPEPEDHFHSICTIRPRL